MGVAATVSQPEPAAVVSKAVSRAAALLGLSNAAFARTIGVSQPTVSRLHKGSFELHRDSKPYELAVLVIRLFRSLDAIVAGDEASVRSWMKAPNNALGGVPGDLVQTTPGLIATLNYVDAARARI